MNDPLTARNTIQNTLGLERSVATWIMKELTDDETATLSVASPAPSNEVVREIAATCLERLAVAVRVQSAEQTITKQFSKGQATMDRKEVKRRHNEKIAADAEFTRLEEVGRQLAYDHPDAQQKRHREAMIEVTYRKIAADRAFKEIERDAPKSPRFDVILDEMKSKQVLVSALQSQNPSITPYVRLDAVEHHGAAIKEAAKRLEEIRKRYDDNRTLVMSIGAKQQIGELEQTISKWESRGRKLAEVGEKIATLKAEIAALAQERDSLMAERKREALAV